MNKLKLFIFIPLLAISSMEAADKDPKIQIEPSEKAHGFGELVENYDKGRKKPSDEAYTIAAKYVRADEPILDIGCGTGLSTLPLIEKFKNVRGCDWDEKMLQSAQAKAPGHFDQASAYNLPYKKEQFGLVTAFSSYHWFCDDAATQEISRVLKPNGGFMVTGGAEKTTKSKGVFGTADKIIEDTLQDVNITDPRENYEPIETLTRNDFEIVEVIKNPRSQEFTVEESIQYIKSRSIWNYVIKAQKEPLVEEKLRAFFESVKNKNGKITKLSNSTYIIAKKK